MKKKFIKYTLHNDLGKVSISRGEIVEFTEEEYVSYIGTHYDTILLPYPF